MLLLLLLGRGMSRRVNSRIRFCNLTINFVSSDVLVLVIYHKKKANVGEASL